MKVFRIIPEFKILRLTFHIVSLKVLNWADYNSFFDAFSIYLKAIYCSVKGGGLLTSINPDQTAPTGSV